MSRGEQETKDERARQKREQRQFEKNIADITRAEQESFDEIISVNGWLADARVWGSEHSKSKIKRRYPGAFGKKVLARLHERLQNEPVETETEHAGGAE